MGNKVTRYKETPKPLALAVTAPKELRSSRRTHYLIRGHGKEATVLATTQGEVLEGRSELFSPYLLAYADGSSPVSPDDPSVPPSPTPDTPGVLPQGGDASFGAGALVLAALTAFALALTMRARSH